jgi:hypothetical protein
MVIQITPDLEAALVESARVQGISPDVLALRVLQERFLPHAERETSLEEWEALVLSLGTDCGVSLTDWALSSEGLYD